MSPLFKILAAILSAFFLPPASALYQGPLESMYFAPRARDVQYLSLSGIHTVNYANVTEVYIKVLECSQLVESLKNEMSKRLNETVPPPHHHCFIPERDLGHIHTFNHNSTQALRCDQYMFSNFPSAMQRAVLYEGIQFQNQETRTLLKIANMVGNIQMALSNFTGLVVNETTEMAVQDVEACERYVVTPNEEAGEGGSEQSGQLRSRNSGPPPSERSGEEESTGNLRSRNLQPPPNVDPTDISFLNLPQAFDEESAAEDATPTATTPTRCSVIENANDQFIYVTELWIALHYLKLDLQQQRNCLRADA